MKNTVLYIIGGVVLIGGGAFLYMKYKKSPTTSTTPPTEGVGSTVTQTTDPVLGTPVKPTVKTLTDEDMLAIQKLRDIIIADANRINKYKKQSSRNAVKEDIKKNIEKLKTYGYALDNQRELIKIVK